MLITGGISLKIKDRRKENRKRDIIFGSIAVILCLVIFIIFLPQIIGRVTETEEVKEEVIEEAFIELEPIAEDETTEQIEIEEIEEEIEDEEEPVEQEKAQQTTQQTTQQTVQQTTQQPTAPADTYNLAAIDGRWDEDYNYYSIPLSNEDQDYLRSLCQKYNVSFRVMLGLIQIESYYNPNSLSSTNDYGICQVNKCHHEWLSAVFGQTNFFDMYFNMECGVYMLSRYLDKGYCIEQALIGYNLSERGMLNKWNNGIHHTYYSDKVLNAANKLY